MAECRWQELLLIDHAGSHQKLVAVLRECS
jgi:hypothetical protein